MRPGRASGQFPELAHKVRLIGVSAFGGGARAARLALELAKHPQGVLKARDARQPLRRDADQRMEAPLEMTSRQPDVTCQAIDRDAAATTFDDDDGVTYA